MKISAPRLFFIFIFIAMLASSCAAVSSVIARKPASDLNHHTAGSQSAKPFAPPSTRGYYGL